MTDFLIFISFCSQICSPYTLKMYVNVNSLCIWDALNMKMLVLCEISTCKSFVI